LIIISDQANSKQLSLTQQDRPPDGLFKLNVEGSRCITTGMSGGGTVLRSDEGFIPFASCFFYGNSHVLSGKARQ